jgi:hypothetical protein
MMRLLNLERRWWYMERPFPWPLIVPLLALVAVVVWIVVW